MADIDVAHLRIQGISVVIAFLDSSFDRKSQGDQNRAMAALQFASRSADLAGNVVLMWHDSSGRTKFMAPPNQHPFFRTADYGQLYRQINRRLSWR
jgi:hypothetical protein